MKIQNNNYPALTSKGLKKVFIPPIKYFSGKQLFDPGARESASEVLKTFFDSKAIQNFAKKYDVDAVFSTYQTTNPISVLNGANSTRHYYISSVDLYCKEIKNAIAPLEQPDIKISSASKAKKTNFLKKIIDKFKKNKQEILEVQEPIPEKVVHIKLSGEEACQNIIKAEENLTKRIQNIEPDWFDMMYKVEFSPNDPLINS